MPTRRPPYTPAPSSFCPSCGTVSGGIAWPAAGCWGPTSPTRKPRRSRGSIRSLHSRTESRWSSLRSVAWPASRSSWPSPGSSRLPRRSATDAIGLPRRTPKHRPQAEGLEGPDPEQIRVEGAWDDCHHREEGVDYERILGKEGRREEQQGEGEGSLRACVLAAVHHQEARREADVRNADEDARDHQPAHESWASGTTLQSMDVFLNLTPTHLRQAASCVGPLRKSRSSPRGRVRGSRGTHTRPRSVGSAGHSSRASPSDDGLCGSPGRGRLRADSRCTASPGPPR